MSYPDSRLPGAQMKSVNPPSHVSSNQCYQTPLLSSLMRPGEAESPAGVTYFYHPQVI